MSTEDVVVKPSAPAEKREGKLSLALIGRPNAGKSSLFNRLTKGDAHVGNFPGITVDILEATAALKSGEELTIYDLPGLYSLDPRMDSSTDERIARDFLEQRRKAGDRLVVVQVLDASHLALGLRLTQSIREHEAELPLLVVATQADMLTKEGREIDGAELADILGVPVVVTSARDAGATEQVLQAAFRAESAGAPKRHDWEPDVIAKKVIKIRSADLLRKAARARTDRLDSVLLHPMFGPAIFLLVMGSLFAAVFLIADPATAACDWAVQYIGLHLRPLLGNGMIASMLVDGALGGVGTVLAFLPQIVLLIAFLELLESTGYLARAAFLVDRLFRVSGLGGKAFVPLLTAHACAVPAIAATRVLRDPKERLTTILVIPLMTCSARLPVYTLLVAAFFGGGALRKSLVCTTLYVVGIAAGLVAAVVMRRTVTKGKGLPLALEMPTYRAPLISVVLKRCRREAADFIKKTGTVILGVSIVLWALLSIPARAPRFEGEPVIQRSVAAAVGKSLEPITKPLGFDWRINVGLIGAFGARELMVGTLGVIFGVEGATDEPAPLVDKIRLAQKPDGSKAYSQATALSLLLFFVLACQCMSTLSAIRRETHSWKMPAFVLVYTYACAYALAAVAFQVGKLVLH